MLLFTYTDKAARYYFYEEAEEELTRKHENRSIKDHETLMCCYNTLICLL